MGGKFIYFYATMKIYSQQYLGAKGFLTIQYYSQIMQKTMKREKLAHRNGANTRVYYEYPT